MQNDPFIKIVLFFMQADVFDNSSPCPNASNPVVRAGVKRTVSDSIGARLRKISFDIGNGRRHSDEFTPEELKNSSQVCNVKQVLHNP